MSVGKRIRLVDWGRQYGLDRVSTWRSSRDSLHTSRTRPGSGTWLSMKKSLSATPGPESAARQANRIWAYAGQTGIKLVQPAASTTGRTQENPEETVIVEHRDRLQIRNRYGRLNAPSQRGQTHCHQRPRDSRRPGTGYDRDLDLPGARLYGEALRSLLAQDDAQKASPRRLHPESWPHREILRTGRGIAPSWWPPTSRSLAISRWKNSS